MLPVWIIYLVISVVTRFPNVQEVMINFANEMRVNWVTTGVDFLINFTPYLIVILAISSIFELRKKPKFDTIRIYEDHIGFVLNGEERTAPYADIEVSYGKFQQSFYLECKSLDLPMEQYYFNALSDNKRLENELLQRANLH